MRRVEAGYAVAPERPRLGNETPPSLDALELRTATSRITDLCGAAPVELSAAVAHPAPRGEAAPLDQVASSYAARIRPLRKDDAPLIDELFSRLTPESRYRRFHTPKPQLSSADLASLARVDGHHRLALAALGCDGQPLAIAHAVRLTDDPAVAEVAAMVADAHQRRGLGTELIRLLAANLAALGVERLVAFVLSESSLPDALLRRGWRITGRDGTATTLAVDTLHVAEAPEAIHPSLSHADRSG